jgi:hypothetical protein
MPANSECLRLVAGVMARQALRVEAQRKDRTGVRATSPASTENTPRSEENYDATKA